MNAEDRLLGFKRHNYVSSSESEDNEDSDMEEEKGKKDGKEEEPVLDFRVQGPKTGPKGVLEDYRRYRQLLAEQDQEKKAELQALAKKFSITCKSSAEEEKEKSALKEAEIDEDDDFMKMYHLKRLEEMKKQAEQYVSSIRPVFGKLLEIPGEEYLDAIDKENAEIVVVMYLYQPGIDGCQAMNGCLTVLAQQYPRVKFCQVLATGTGISNYFLENGLPALLVYQNKQLIGNFVKLASIFGDDFYASDVESFLIENGILSENTPELSSNVRTNEDNSDDDSS